MTLVAPITQGGNFARMPDLAFLYIAKKAMCTAWCCESGADDGSTRPAGKAYWSGAGEVVEEALLRLQAVVE